MNLSKILSNSNIQILLLIILILIIFNLYSKKCNIEKFSIGGQTCGDYPGGDFLTCNTGTRKPDATVVSTNNFQNDCCGPRTCGDAPGFLTCNTGTVKPDATVMSTNNFQNDCCCLGMNDTLTTNIDLGNIRTCGDYAQYMIDDTGVVGDFIAHADAAGVTECCGWNPTTGFQ